jgi:hypothetical protein
MLDSEQCHLTNGFFQGGGAFRWQMAALTVNQGNLIRTTPSEMAVPSTPAANCISARRFSRIIRPAGMAGDQPDGAYIMTINTRVSEQQRDGGRGGAIYNSGSNIASDQCRFLRQQHGLQCEQLRRWRRRHYRNSGISISSPALRR